MKNKFKKLIGLSALSSGLAFASGYFGGASSGGSSIGGSVVGGTNTAVLFVNPGATLNQDASNFSYNVTAHQLTLGVAPVITPFSTAGVVHNSAAGLLSSSLVVNADVSASAAIAYSKLSLATSIVNGDVSTSAAIAYSKLATLSTGQILLGNAGTPTATTLTGDVTVGATGVTAIGSAKVTNGMLAGSIDASTKLTNAVPIGNGGTGQATAALGFDALAPTTSKGDSIVRSSTTNARFAVGTDGQIIVADSSQSLGQRWATPLAQSDGINNLGLSAAVASSALTITLTQADGSTAPTTALPVKVSMRNGTAATGGFVERSITSTLTLVVSSGSTLGHKSGTNQYIYVYLIDSDGAGTMKLGASSSVFDDGTLQTTVAEGGVGGATSNQSLYSNAIYTSRAVRMVGRMKVNEATAGTWASTPTEIALQPFKNQVVALSVGKSSAQTFTTTLSDLIGWDTPDVDSMNGFNVTNGQYTISTGGIYLIAAACGGGASGTYGVQMQILLNGSVKSIGIIPPNAVNSVAGNIVPINLRLVPNDVIKVQVSVSTGTQASNTSNAVNRLTITKVGDL